MGDSQTLAADDEAHVETLCANDWVSLLTVRKPAAGVNGYVYSHETRCRGRIVAVLPYVDTPQGRGFLLKSEVTPCWSFEPVVSALTGGYEGGDIADDAVRELYEEAGFDVARDELIPLGESYASKSADTVYSLFAVDVTGRTHVEPPGDGSRVESESATIWASAHELHGVWDPQVALMYLRLQRVHHRKEG